MAEAGWFYAHGDEEKGPISTAELQRLVESGQVSPSDLVWQEGMAEWVPASDVPGLCANSPTRRSAGDGGRPQMPGGEAIFGWARALSHPLFLAGLLLALLARGCDRLDARNTARLQAKVELAQNDFADAYAEERAELEQERQDILDAQSDADEGAGDDDATDEDGDAADEANADLAEIDKKLTDLDERQAKERAELERGDWRELQAAARDASNEAAASAYWHEWWFLLGTLLLVTGLVGIAYAFTGPQRWIALVLLGVVLLSLYGGGIRLGVGA